MFQHTAETTENYSQKYQKTYFSLKQWSIKNILDTTKRIKNKQQPNNLKHARTSYKFEEHKTNGTTK